MLAIRKSSTPVNADVGGEQNPDNSRCKKPSLLDQMNSVKNVSYDMPSWRRTLQRWKARFTEFVNSFSFQRKFVGIVISKYHDDKIESPEFKTHLTNLIDNKPDVLLVLASDPTFRHNNFPLYFKQNQIQSYGDFTVSSFVSAAGSKILNRMEIENRIVCIAKGGVSVSIPAIYVNNWSDLRIERADWNNLNEYVCSYHQSRLEYKVAGNELSERGLNSLPKIQLLHFNDEAVEMIVKQLGHSDSQ